IYQQYLKAFKKGVYNYIKEEPDAVTGQMVPRKYFSGGFSTYDNAQVSLEDRIKTTSLLPASTIQALSQLPVDKASISLQEVDSTSVIDDTAMLTKPKVFPVGAVFADLGLRQRIHRVTYIQAQQPQPMGTLVMKGAMITDAVRHTFPHLENIDVY